VRASLSPWSGAPGEGWPSWAFSNHDAPRAVTRWTLDGDMARAARLNMLLLLALRGNPIIYQGEELGLPQGEVAFEDLLDPEAIANWPHTLGRDGARTPMPWQGSAPQAGFSSANRTWLKLDPAHAAFAVDRQAEDTQSTLHYTRQLLRLRRRHPALVTGDITLLDTPDAMVAFVRRTPQSAVLCAFNLGEEVQGWSPPEEFAQGRVLASENAVGSPATLPMVLAPGSGYWAVNDAEHA
jgi:alpha-glucosidase